MSAPIIAATLVGSLIAGLVSMFVYAAIRPRFGAGPTTAIIAAVTLWFGGYLLSLAGYGMAGLYPTPTPVLWARSVSSR